MTGGINAATPEERAWFEQRFHDYPWFAQNAPLRVLDKETTTSVPLRFNVAQKYVTARLWTMAREGQLVRALIPKFRQGGITTWGLGRFVHIGQTRKDRMMMLMLHDLQLAEPMHDRLELMAKGIGEGLPEGAPVLPRSAITTNKTGRMLGFNTGSLIQIETAGKTKGIGRGNTIHHVHATELPSWPDPTKTMKGLMESVPELGMFESSIILESTSEGVGDWWYWACMRAEQGRGEFALIFLPWWLELAYGARDPEPVALKHAWTPGGNRPLADCLKEPLAPSEEELAKRIMREAPSYGLTFLTPDMIVQKLLWRRRKIESSDPETFMQEYPADLAESFRGTGRPVFTSASVSFHRSRVWLPTDTGRDVGEKVVTPALQRARILQVDTVIDGMKEKPVYDLRDDVEGPLHIWKGYEPSERYIIGGDPSSGEGDDPSAIQIVRTAQDAFEQVAVWHGWVGQIELAYITAWLARAYGNALIVPEYTGLGSEYVNQLMRIVWSGRKVYQRRVLSARGDKMQDRPGFDMNVATRPQVIETLYHMLKTEVPIIRHEPTLMEIEQFRLDEKGRADHPSGGHSDLLMAFGMAAYARNQHASPVNRPRTKQGARYEASKQSNVRSRLHAGKRIR